MQGSLSTLLKRCTVCAIELPATLVFFRKGKPGELPLRASCLACEKEYSRVHRATEAGRMARKKRRQNRTKPEKYVYGGAKRIASNMAYFKRYPEKKRAANLVYKALKSGKLIRQPCEACGTTSKVQAHHDDYSKPLNVKWLCQRDHLKHHCELVGQRFRG